MKQKILDALKAKFEGVSAKILDGIAEKAAKTVTTEEEVTTYVEGVTFAQVLDSYGDRRATEAAKTAVANYEDKYKLKAGVKVEEPKPKPDPKPDPKQDDDQTPAWAKALIAKNEAMEKELAAMKGEKLADSRKSALAGILKEAPEKLRTRYEKDFERLNFTDDDDFNGWLAETKTSVDELTTQYIAKGGRVTKPKAGAGAGGTETVNPLVQSRIDAAGKEPASTAIAGLQ